MAHPKAGSLNPPSIPVEGTPPSPYFKSNIRTYATVLVKNGTLKLGDYIVGGCTYAKVRRMTTADGKSVKLAPPGTAVEVSGWKGRPDAGDQVLQANKESDAKLVVRNRLVQRESKRDQQTIELINERRLAAKRELYQEREKKMVAAEVKRSGKTLPGILKDKGTEEGEKKGPTMVRFLVKADVGGSAEAVEEAIKDLGNEEVKVEVVDTSVGEITESDITVAAASNGLIP
jgi:translation initiation factor IF-2